jgi:hypothetical protein
MTDSSSENPTNYAGMVWGVAIGVLVTPVTFLLAIYSTGGGGGDYGFFKFFYPYLILMKFMVGMDGGTIAIGGLSQFPIYGWIIGASRSRRRAVVAAAIILFVHLTAVGLCFWPAWWGR